MYADFLQNQLQELLEDVPLRVRRELIYQHDGAPAHFCRQVRDVLNTNYPDKWISRGGPITWPARSPDLKVLDFFVWGYLKNLVEDRHNSTENEVREATIAAFGTITPDMAHRATRDCSKSRILCMRKREV